MDWYYINAYPARKVRIIPGTVVPKKDKTEGARLVWNESWPVAKLYTGIVQMPPGKWVEVGAKSQANLPSGANFEWA